MKYRVGFDARWYNDSGVGTYVAELLRTMAPMQRDFELVVYEDPRKPLAFLNGQAVERVPVRGAKYSMTGQIEMALRCRRDRLDVFHSPFYVAPMAAGCPVIVTMFDLIPFLFPSEGRAKRLLVRSGYRMAARKAAHILAPSENSARDIHRILGVAAERIATAHIGVRRDCYCPVATEGELAKLEEKYGVKQPYVVAASARNWRHKNLEGALNALRLARGKHGVRFQTVVYGPEEGLRSVEGPAGWRDLELRHVGYLPTEERGALFRHAQMFIMPSLYEGFGLPVLEAMSCGCPVVTSNRGALPEVAGQGAQIFDPLDVEGMADAVCCLLKNEDERQRWREAALHRAKDFSWTSTAEATIEVYLRVAQAAG